MLSSTGWVQSIVIFLVSFFFFKAAPLPLNVVLGFFWTGFLVNVSLTGAPGAFFSVCGATVFLMVTAAVNGFLAGTAAAAGFFSIDFLSATGFGFSTVFLVVTGTFFVGSDSFFIALTGSGFFSTLAGSFLSFLADLGCSSAGRFTALLLGSSLTFLESSLTFLGSPLTFLGSSLTFFGSSLTFLGSSLTFLGSSFLLLVEGAACCCPFFVGFTSGSLALGFSGSDFLPLGSALPALGLSLVGSTLTLDLGGCCAASFLPLSFLLSATFFGADACKQKYKLKKKY